MLSTDTPMPANTPHPLSYVLYYLTHFWCRERRLLGKEIVPKIVNIAMKADLVLSYYFEEHLTEKVADVKESLNLPPNIDSLLSLS
jgi:hypothetical protein